jgi:hypothetical protein
MYQIEYFKELKLKAEEDKFKYPLNINTDKGKYYLTVKTINYIKYSFVISSQNSTTYGKNFEGLITESYFEKKIRKTYRELKNRYKYQIEKDIGENYNVIWQDFGESTKGTVARIFIMKELNSSELNDYAKWHLNSMEILLRVIQKYIDIVDNDSNSNNNNITYEDNLIEDIENIIDNKILIDTETENLVKCRIGQGDFRKKLIKYWGGCSVTKFYQIEILIASHIKPWRDSSNTERLDHFNGLLLTPNLDKLFDKGYISFDNNGSILISKDLIDYEILGINKNMKINIDKEHQKYLKFHRSDIFGTYNKT